MKNTTILMIAMAILVSGCQTLQGIQNDFKSMTGSLAPSSVPVDEDARNSIAVTSNGCPPIVVDPQLDSAVEFYDMEKTGPEQEVARVNLASTQTVCEMDDEFLTVRIDLTFIGALGPKAKRKDGDRPYFSHPYFIAVTDDQNNELARELFAATMSYESGQEKIELVETIRQKLPLENSGKVPPYQIHIGFNLTEEQLFYNASL